jgi:hypothetical protein
MQIGSRLVSQLCLLLLRVQAGSVVAPELDAPPRLGHEHVRGHFARRCFAVRARASSTASLARAVASQATGSDSCAPCLPGCCREAMSRAFRAPLVPVQQQQVSHAWFAFFLRADMRMSALIPRPRPLPCSQDPGRVGGRCKAGVSLRLDAQAAAGTCVTHLALLSHRLDVAFLHFAVYAGIGREQPGHCHRGAAQAHGVWPAARCLQQVAKGRPKCTSLTRSRRAGVEPNQRVFLSAREYGHEPALHGGCKPADNCGGAAHRVCAPVHLELHFFMRKHQGSRRACARALDRRAPVPRS